MTNQLDTHTQPLNELHHWWDDIRNLNTHLQGLLIEVIQVVDGVVTPRVVVASDAVVHETAILDTSDGPISIGPNVRICAGAYIKGPVVIGKDSLIGNGAIVRGAYIASNVLIGAYAEVKNSMILDGTSIGPMAYASDSMLRQNVFLGAMVRTSNYRLDRGNITVIHNGKKIDTGMDKLGAYIGAGASLGVQCVILPGRRIEVGSIFGPGIIIQKNLPAAQYNLRQDLISNPL